VSVFDQSAYDVRFEWGELGLRALAPVTDVLVIVDVLSFSTAVEVAVARGALVLPFPFRDPAAAAAYAEQHHATLAVHRQDALHHTHRYSLSPVSLQDIPEGTSLVLPSPNGSALSRIANEYGATVFAGCLRNASAVASAIASAASGNPRAVVSGNPHPTVGVIAAGERWPDGSLRPALEDLVGAGAILREFAADIRSPEAELAVAAFRHTEGDLLRYLQTCASGRELLDIGFADDVRLAAEFDVGTTAPVFTAGAFRAYGLTT
jgi:2-phosphosulfolactate phosphatase